MSNRSPKFTSSVLPRLSSRLPPHPPFLPPLSPRHLVFITPLLFVFFPLDSRWMRSRRICLLVPDFISLNTMFSCFIQVISKDRIPWCAHTIFSYPLLSRRIPTSISWLLWIEQQWAVSPTDWFHFLGYRHSDGRPNHMTLLFLISQGTSVVLSIMTTPICTPTTRWRGSLSPHPDQHCLLSFYKQAF